MKSFGDWFADVDQWKAPEEPQAPTLAPAPSAPAAPVYGQEPPWGSPKASPPPAPPSPVWPSAPPAPCGGKIPTAPPPPPPPLPGTAINPTKDCNGDVCKSCQGTGHAWGTACEECDEQTPCEGAGCSRHGLPNYNDGSGWRFYCGSSNPGCCP